MKKESEKYGVILSFIDEDCVRHISLLNVLDEEKSANSYAEEAYKALKAWVKTDPCFHHFPRVIFDGEKKDIVIHYSEETYRPHRTYNIFVRKEGKDWEDAPISEMVEKLNGDYSGLERVGMIIKDAYVPKNPASTPLPKWLTCDDEEFWEEHRKKYEMYEKGVKR